MAILQPFAGSIAQRAFRFKPESGMLSGALIFAAAALVAGVFGFSGLASAAAAIARILFFIFVAMFLVTLIAGIL